jgi:hypothetical protein
MGVTNFPDGLTTGGVTVLAMEAGTVVVPAGASGTAFTPSSLTSISYVMAAPYNAGAALAGYAGVHASHSGGTIKLIGISAAGTASTASGTATWLAVGS